MLGIYNESSEEKIHPLNGQRRETALPMKKNFLLRDGSDVTNGSNENIIMQLKNSDHESM